MFLRKSDSLPRILIRIRILEKSGAWFYYDGSRIGQGKDNARQFIESDPAMMAEIEAKIKEKGAAVEAQREENMEDDEEEDEELDIRLLDLDDDGEGSGADADVGDEE